MRMSCNGCRVLRKGCSENCSIKPCLDWIASPESQANATVFLAKFYGRAGLLNLLSAAPHHHRPAMFKSLLYEACGRIVNPIYGSVGLLWSGNWQLCQAAVEAVLKGKPITPITSEADACANAPPTKCYDIRHVMREENSAASSHLTRVKPNRTSPFKRTGLVKPKATKAVAPALKPASVAETAKDRVCERGKDGSTSHGSSVSHPDMSRESMESMVCVEMDEVAARAKPEAGEVKLELTLGFEPIATTAQRGEPRRSCTWKARDGVCNMGLELEL